MTEARDIIANALRGPQPSVKESEAFIVSDYDAHMVSANIVLAALTAAGWTLAPPGSRVVPDGGVDAETVERCAEVADVIGDEYDARATGARLTSESIDSLRAAESAANRIAAALRALAKAKP